MGSFFILRYPVGFFGVFSLYKTQTILFRNAQDPSITIEFQMKDVGARGYKRRTVKVEPFLIWDTIQEIDISSINRKDWIEVNENINELGLRGG